MYLENGELSSRQMFRIGLLENITLGIVILPYVTLNIAGEWHFVSLLIGIVFMIIYCIWMYFMVKQFPNGIVGEIKKQRDKARDNRAKNNEMTHAKNRINNSKNSNIKNNIKLYILGIIALTYMLRFLLRGGIILLYFGTVIKEYMLRDFNLYLLISSFALICGYGAKRDIEKRGRLIELLFWWMIVPLIFSAVFAVSSLDISSFGKVFVAGNGGVVSGKIVENELGNIMGNTAGTHILFGAYIVFLVLSTVEITMFTLVKQKNHGIKNVTRILIWVVISILLAYVFELGILGVGWLKSSSTASLNVMEAAAIPGDFITRMDYPVLSFWIIGAFAVLSGYLYYAKEMGNLIFVRKVGKEPWWVMCVMVIFLLLFTVCWDREDVAKYFARYMLHFDIGLSILMPIILWLFKIGSKEKYESQ